MDAITLQLQLCSTKNYVIVEMGVYVIFSSGLIIRKFENLPIKKKKGRKEKMVNKNFDDLNMFSTVFSFANERNMLMILTMGCIYFF